MQRKHNLYRDSVVMHNSDPNLHLLAEGCSNEEIGGRLFISVNTVKTHTKKINSKLGVKRRTQAVMRAKTLGLLV